LRPGRAAGELADLAGRRSEEQAHHPVIQFLGWCEENGVVPDLAEPHAVRAWLAAGRASWRGTTMQTKLSTVRAFADWLVEEGELHAHGLHRVAWPKADERIPPALSRAQMDAIIAANDRRTANEKQTLIELRDEALFSVLFDTMLRSDELLQMLDAADERERQVNLRDRTVKVMGKGRRERYAVFSPQSARRLDRYMRAKRKAGIAPGGAFWTTAWGKPLTYGGLYKALQRRGERAGIRVHPHMLRAGGAIDWRRKGGSSEALMTLAGWKSMDMLRRYTRSADQELAIEEAKRLHEQG
jgi:integrase/recombinase XerD